jgi:hypothetical protein
MPNAKRHLDVVDTTDPAMEGANRQANDRARWGLKLRDAVYCIACLLAHDMPLKLLQRFTTTAVPQPLQSAGTDRVLLLLPAARICVRETIRRIGQDCS